MFNLSYFLFICIVPSAIYTEANGSQYAAMLFLFLSIFFKSESKNGFIKLVTSPFMFKKLLGGLVLSSLYVGSQLYNGYGIRDAIVPFVSIFLFFVTFAATILMLQTKQGKKTVVISGLVALAVILFGQYLVLTGYVTKSIAWLTDVQIGYLNRNGGFHNANGAGVVALTILFGLTVISSNIRSSKLLIPGIIIAFAIILIAQSRSGLLFFGLLSFYIVKTIYVSKKMSTAIYFVAIVVAVIFADQAYKERIIADNLRIESFQERVSGTSTDDGRVGIALVAWELFLESPLIGKGPDTLKNRYGISSHNMFLDSLAAYGLLGSAYILLGSILLYKGQSRYDYLFCLALPVMFSHNLYDQTALQVGLGFAFGSSFALRNIRYRKANVKRQASRR